MAVATQCSRDAAPSSQAVSMVVASPGVGRDSRVLTTAKNLASACFPTAIPAELKLFSFESENRQ